MQLGVDCPVCGKAVSGYLKYYFFKKKIFSCDYCHSSISITEGKGVPWPYIIWAFCSLVLVFTIEAIAEYFYITHLVFSLAVLILSLTAVIAILYDYFIYSRKLLEIRVNLCVNKSEK